LILGEQQYFVWDTASQSTKSLHILNFGGSVVPWAPVATPMVKTWIVQILRPKSPKTCFQGTLNSENAWQTLCIVFHFSIPRHCAAYRITGNFSPKRLWHPSDINAPLSGVCRSRNRQKYSTVSNGLHLTESQDLHAGLLPSHLSARINNVICSYISLPRENFSPNLTKIRQTRSPSLAQFSTCGWTVQN